MSETNQPQAVDERLPQVSNPGNQPGVTPKKWEQALNRVEELYALVDYRLRWKNHEILPFIYLTLALGGYYSALINLPFPVFLMVSGALLAPIFIEDNWYKWNKDRHQQQVASTIARLLDKRAAFLDYMETLPDEARKDELNRLQEQDCNNTVEELGQHEVSNWRSMKQFIIFSKQTMRIVEQCSEIVKLQTAFMMRGGELRSVQILGVGYTGPQTQYFHSTIAGVLQTHSVSELCQAANKLPRGVRRKRERKVGLETIWWGGIPRRLLYLGKTQTFTAVWDQQHELGRPTRVSFLFGDESADNEHQDEEMSILGAIALFAGLADGFDSCVSVVTKANIEKVVNKSIRISEGGQTLKAWYHQVVPHLGPRPSRRLTVSHKLGHVRLILPGLRRSWREPGVRAELLALIRLAWGKHGDHLPDGSLLGIWNGKVYMFEDNIQNTARLYLPDPPEYYAPGSYEENGEVRQPYLNGRVVSHKTSYRYHNGDSVDQRRTARR